MKLNKHKFFSEIDWIKARNRQLEPYYIPEILGKLDITHFKPKLTKSIEGDIPKIEEPIPLCDYFSNEAEHYAYSQSKQKPLGDFESHIINNNLLEYF